MKKQADNNQCGRNIYVLIENTFSNTTSTFIAQKDLMKNEPEARVN